MNYDRAYIDRIKAKYPPGTRIELEQMNDPYAPVPSGTKGTVVVTDDSGTLHMKWDNGRSLGLVVGVDHFRVIPEIQTMKLYMPLTINLYERNEYGDLEEEPTELDGGDVLEYEDKILVSIHRYTSDEEMERGLMQWYHENDSVNEKVVSVRPTVERMDRQLMGVLVCRVKGELTESELDTLKETMASQMSDGWGEGFEQREIKTGNGEMYVSFWNSDNWQMLTAEEMRNNSQQMGMQMQ